MWTLFTDVNLKPAACIHKNEVEMQVKLQISEELCVDCGTASIDA